VLSSDDEEGGDPASFALVPVEEPVIQTRSLQEAVAKPREASHIDDIQVGRMTSWIVVITTSSHVGLNNTRAESLNIRVRAVMENLEKSWNL